MSNRMYTDEELCWATQVAYCNVSQEDIAIYYRDHNEEYPTLQEIFNKHGYAIYYNQDLIDDDQVGDKLVMQQTAMEFIDAVKAGTVCQGWRAIAVSNEEHQNETGFRAITIATSEEDAIVGFRGSESWNMNQLVEDWVVADFTMLASELTEQETLAGEYLYNTIADTDFENFAVTGHSLGGNLSIVSTVLTKHIDNQEQTDYASRIKQTVSFDGPGHPDEFIEQFQTEIDQMADVMTHYQWSWVGAILTSLCEENGRYIKKESDTFHTDIASMLRKHSTASLEFDENGMLADAEFGMFEGIIHLITNSVDDMEAIQDFLASLINYVAVAGQNICDLHEMASQEEMKKQVVDYCEKYYAMCINMAIVTAYTNNPAVWTALYPDRDIPFKNLSTSIKEYYEAKKLVLGEGLELKTIEAVLDCMVTGFQIKPIDYNQMWMKEICDIFLEVIMDNIVDAPTKTELGSWFLREGIVELAYVTSPIWPIVKVNEYANINNTDIQKNEYQSIADKLPVGSLKNVLQGFKESFANQLSKEDENLNTILETCPIEDVVTYRRRHVRMVHDNMIIQACALDSDAWNALTGAGDPFAALKESTNEYLATVEQITANNSEPAVTEALRGHKNTTLSLVQTTLELVFQTIDNQTNVFGDIKWMAGVLIGINQLFEQACTVWRLNPDPLVFDMDSDGFEILDVEEGVYFDEDSTGLKEKTQWVDSDDALLAMDLNGDGVINDGSELFGSSTVLADGSLAKTGFEALAQYDSNGDMVIDEQDEMFSELLLWQDVNTDGISQANELYTLEQAGVSSISLHSDTSNGVNSADVTMTDGTVAQMGEFSFASELYNTKGEDIEISAEIQELPNVRALGRVDSLHNLMQLDETGTLKEYVTEFTRAATKAEREQLVTDILYYITGANAVAEGSRGSEFDARKLHVIEQVMGRDFMGTDGSNPVNSAADILQEVYDSIFGLYYSMLGGQTFLNNYLDMTFWSTDAEGAPYLNTTLFDIHVLCEIHQGQDMVEIVGDMGRYIATLNKENEENLMEYMWNYADYSEYFTAIAQYSHRDMVLGADEAELLQDSMDSALMMGFDGADTLYGGHGNDELYGGRGDDKLYGQYNNDLLNGGAGDDYLDGGSGDDVYEYGRGYGNDTINNNSSDSLDMDSVHLKELNREDVALEVVGNNLAVKVLETGETLTIQNYFTGGRYGIDKLVFADGSEVNYEEFIAGELIKEGSEEADTISLSNARGVVSLYGKGGDDTLTGTSHEDKLYGEEGADILYGGQGNDELYGGIGNDKLYGMIGNDLINGGAGDDYLDAGSGNDVYEYGRGYGNDTINNNSSDSSDMDMLSIDANAKDLLFAQNGLDLLVSIIGEPDTLTIPKWYHGGRNQVENINTADGYTLANTQVDQLIQAMASYESTSGMTWADGVRANDETVNQLVSQMWIKQEVV